MCLLSAENFQLSYSAIFLKTKCYCILTYLKIFMNWAASHIASREIL